MTYFFLSLYCILDVEKVKAQTKKVNKISACCCRHSGLAEQVADKASFKVNSNHYFLPRTTLPL